MDNPIDFFISFSWKDIDKVTDIVETIQNYGGTCWFQKKDSRTEYAKEIVDGIRRSKVFLVFLSPASATSMYVLNEIACAVEWFDSKRDSYLILPVALENFDINDGQYKDVKFYLGRLNIVFEKDSLDCDELVSKIYAQAVNLVKPIDRRENSLYSASEVEKTRIRYQNELLYTIVKNHFDEMFTEIKNPFVLDVGCADGDNIMMRLEGREYSHLLGIDIDESKISEANEKYGSEKNKFEFCDILSDKLEELLENYLDDYDKRGFDLIHISAVLLHLGDPVKLLTSLRRYLTKNGFLYIQDEDDGANLVYPGSVFYDTCFYLWQWSKMSGDRQCGRKIYKYLTDSGFKRVELKQCGINNTALQDEQKNTLWDLYFNPYLWGVVEENKFGAADALPKLEKYKSKYEENKKNYDDGNVFIQLGFLFFTARK